jgi:hypothetical protein
MEASEGGSEVVDDDADEYFSCLVIYGDDEHRLKNHCQLKLV